MSLAEDLLDQADHLCAATPRRPKQANLRRAASAAYYALFHRLVGDGVALLLPARLSELRLLLARKYAHATMKKAAQAAATSPIPQLASVARAFVTLQEARHEADYDLGRTFTKLEVTDLVALARGAFADWDAVQPGKEAERFLVELLIGRLN